MITLMNRRIFIFGALGILCILVGAILLVTTKTEKIEPIPATAKFDHHGFEAQTQELLKRFNPSDTSSSFNYVRQQLATNPAFARDCHPLMHRFAHDTFAQYKNFAAAMTKADEVCNSGYVHGLVEANFKTAPSVESAIQSSCPNKKDESFQQWQCFHGMGHGIMYSNDKDEAKSIKTCQKLSGDFAQTACINGVFMEKFIIVSHSGDHAPKHTHADISLCKQQSNEVKTDCYSYAPTAYLEMNTNQYDQAVTWCQSNAETAHVGSCISGVGAQVMKENIANPKFGAQFCLGLEGKNAQFRTACSIGALDIYSNHAASTEASKPLCENEFAAISEACHQFLSDKHKQLNI